MRKVYQVPARAFRQKGNVIDATQEFRKEIGLPPLVKKELNCLRCETRFTSWHWNNRLCNLCRGDR